MPRGRGYAAMAAVATAWCAVYAAAAWPALRGPLPAPVLLKYGALPVPLSLAQGPRLVTTWLVHVDLLHLAGNLAAWFLAWLPWPDPRRDAARWRLVALCVCGIWASGASVLHSGAASRAVVSAGPSGAILGVLIVAALQRGRARKRRALWLGAAAALLAGGALTGGDTAAHLGGALAGLGLGLLLRHRPVRAGEPTGEPSI